VEVSNWDLNSAYSANTAGFMHAQLDELSVDVSDMTFTSLEAEDKGGGFYATLWKDVTMSNIVLT